MDIDKFNQSMEIDGYCAFPNILDQSAVEKLRSDCLKWVRICEEYQISAGINESGDGTGHHSLGANDSIDWLIDQHILHKYIDSYFEHRPYILHACNPIAGAPGKLNYVHNIHRDTRTFIPHYHFRLNMIVMLDDFTLENGATHLLVGSHNQLEIPNEAEFNKSHIQLTGSAGTVVLFNSYMWHRGGVNSTQQNRVALTLSFGPAFIKPQMDYARLLGEEYGSHLSELTRQVLGYYSRVPCSLNEWYQKAESRLYRSDQG